MITGEDVVMDSIFDGLGSVGEEWEDAASSEDESEGAEIVCLRCGTPMQYIKQEKIQLGERGFLSGDWAHISAGALSVHIFMCPLCGKLEFFDPYVFEHGGEMEEVVEEPQIAQVECPQCGKMHDMDFPRCPFCKYDYRED